MPRQTIPPRRYPSQPLRSITPAATMAARGKHSAGSKRLLDQRARIAELPTAAASMATPDQSSPGTGLAEWKAYPARCQGHQRRPFHGHEHDAEQQHPGQAATGRPRRRPFPRHGPFRARVRYQYSPSKPWALTRRERAPDCLSIMPRPTSSPTSIRSQENPSVCSKGLAADEIEGPDADEGVGFRIGRRPKAAGRP